MNYVANNVHNGTDFFQSQWNASLESDEGRAFLQPRLRELPPPFDLGDYWKGAVGLVLLEGSIIRDDWGNWYIRGGLGPSFPGGSISRGDMLINTDPEGKPFHNLVDIDRLDISEAEKSELMRTAMVGWSASGSASGLFGFLGGGANSALMPPHHATFDIVLAPPGASVTPVAYTLLIWSAE